jgi:hypothetical protein
MTITDETIAKLGIPPRCLTYRESENRRAYQSQLLQGAIFYKVPVSDLHTHATYNHQDHPWRMAHMILMDASDKVDDATTRLMLRRAAYYLYTEHIG